MASIDREQSPSRSQQHSNAESGRLSVPMWDSSDPDRAPPPLPLNPVGSNQPTTKPNTSATVAAAAQALADRVRESAGASPYVTNAIYDRSPEKSPVKTPQHKRLQSLQTGSVRDHKVSLENVRPSDYSAGRSRPSTPTPTRDQILGSPDASPTLHRAPSVASSGMDLSKDTPVLRPTTRQPPRPLFGEPPPTSATVLAMQNMQIRDVDMPVLGDITNSSAPYCPPSLNFDSIHQQMLNLTSIATTLQKEMTALSRRSKDNATDLISLKEATTRRDEDIRKSLRELVNNSRAAESGLLGWSSRLDTSRSSSAFASSSHFLDNIPSTSSPVIKSISLPKIPSPHNIDALNETAHSPPPHSLECAASVAMLEKIIRDMVTKEGQEQLLATLSDLFDKSSKEASNIGSKVEELVELHKEKSTSLALVRHSNHQSSKDGEPSRIDINFDNLYDGNLEHLGREISMAQAVKPSAAAFISDDLKNLLQKVKDSVAQGGGMTGEVKSLVRELRAEVLGMGRELGRKLDLLEQVDRKLSTSESSMGRDHLERIVQEGLSDLKEHMEELIRSRRRQSSVSSVSRNTVDSQEVYDVVKQVLVEHGIDQSQALQSQAANFDREAILAAVKEAYEAYRPELEAQQGGLGRDEILQCLRDGLEEYQSSREMRSSNQTSDLSKKDIIDSMCVAMQHFTPPVAMTESAELKEEILAAVRESLEAFNPPAREMPQWKPNDVTREDVLDAVREGLATFKKEGARELEINRDDLFEAVQAGLENGNMPFGGYGDQVLHSLHEIVEGMRVEFKQYSAANGRDTEQVLDALKDGLETLRAEIETYVDRAQDVTGKDEIIDSVKGGLEMLRSNVEIYVTQRGNNDSVSERSELVNYIKAEFEQLHEAIANQGIVEQRATKDTEQIMMALSAGFAALKSHSADHGIEEPGEELLDAMKEEFEQLKDAILSKTTAHKDELLDNIQDSLAGLHGKFGSRNLESNSNAELFNSMKEQFDMLRETFAAPVLYPDALTNKESIINSLRECLDGVRVQLSADQSEAAGEALAMIKEELEHFREAISCSLVPSTHGTSRESIVEAMQQALRSCENPAARDGNSTTNAEALDTVRAELEHLRQSLATALVQSCARGESSEILDSLQLSLDELRSEVTRKLDNPRLVTSASGVMLDDVHEGLKGLLLDIEKRLDKPVDMTVSYEILDALKGGIASVKSDLALLISGKLTVANSEVVLADAPNDAVGRGLTNGTVVSEALNRNDIERLEVMLAHLQVKVEAVHQNMQNSTALPSVDESRSTQNTAKKEDLAGIFGLLQSLQTAVSVLVSRETESSANSVTREDTDAIETLLQNTKAKIDEHILPGLDAVVTRDNLAAVEAVVRDTQEAVEALATRLDGSAVTKDDLGSIKLLTQQAILSLEDIKARMSSDSGGEQASKSDIDVIGIICTGLKNKLEEFESESMASKTDIELLTSLLKELKENHSSWQNRYEADIKVTATAFDDRREESKAILGSIAELKVFVDEAKDELKSRMKRGNQDLRALDEMLQSIEDKIDAAPNTLADIQELKELISAVPTQVQTAADSLKNEQSVQTTAILQGHDEHRAAIVIDVVEKLDDRFHQLMARHDAQEVVMQTNAEIISKKAVQQDDVLARSREVAEDLKLTIDTLGGAVTGLAPALEEATRKMSDDSKTVFNRIEEMHIKLGENHLESKTDCQVIRDDVLKSLATIGLLHQELTSHNPKVIDGLQNLLSMIEQDFENSRKFQEQSQQHVQRSYDEWRDNTEDIKSSLASMPRIEAPMLPPPPQNHDDTEVQAKLDELLHLANKPAETGPQLQMIQEIHKQLNTIGTEMSAFAAFQTKLLTVEHDTKEKEANQAALDLSRCLAEKEVLEPAIADLRATKHSLGSDIKQMQSKNEALRSQNMRLSAELSSIETALDIRREELRIMDARANALERRIIEGVMDHSRALLIMKMPKGPANMNLKRVASNMSNTTTIPSQPPSAVNASVEIAMKSRPRQRQNPTVASSPGSRRILSLGQITNNVPKGGKSIMPVPTATKDTFTSLKRSQSVKNPSVRQSSWAGPGSLGEYDKENGVLTEEDSDPEDENDGPDIETSLSQRSGSYIDGRALEGNRPLLHQRTSFASGPSDYTDGTGSYFTDSETNNRASSGSTIRSTAGAVASVTHSAADGDEGESQYGEDEIEHRLLEAPLQPPKLAMVIHGSEGHDSGLGSDLPTAAWSATVGDDYFRKAVEQR